MIWDGGRSVRRVKVVENMNATKAGVACAFFFLLLSLIGRDPLSLTFCTASLAFSYANARRSRGGNMWEPSGGGQRRSLSLSFSLSASFPR